MNVSRDRTDTPLEERRWRLWQVETSMACELSCVMCPWHGVREAAKAPQLMSEVVWDRLRPYLGEVACVDLSGGGEPLLHPQLTARLAEAKTAGCEVGFLSNAFSLDEARTDAVLAAGVDWLAFSVDGATPEVYESIRLGTSFERVTGNIRRLANKRAAGTPRIALNFVIMESNAHQLEAIVELAAELGVDQVNFKQCDVSRGELGRGLGLFRASPDRETRRLDKALKRARRRARKLKIETTAFPFVPEELPVCAQDPRTSLFIGWNGRVAPCINLAYSGPTAFFGRETELPEVCYGTLTEASLLELWESQTCRRYRDTFAAREAAHDARLMRMEPGTTMEKLERAIEEARMAMPPPPAGCEVCHYLYGT